MNPILLAALAFFADPDAVASPNQSSQSYIVSLDDKDIGYAELGIERPSAGPKKGTFKYTFLADIAVSGDPCLRSHEESAGSGKLSDTTLPEELFVALAGELGPVCKTVKSEGAAAKGEKEKAKGKGCWTEASFESASGTLFDQPVDVRYSANQMPEHIAYKGLGIVYRSAVDIPDALKECKRTVADDGIEAPGGKGVAARKLTHAVYDTKPAATTVQTSTVALPASVKQILADQHSEELSSCQAAAETLSKALQEKGLQARAVAGLILDDGRYYPHAWVEAKIGKEWVALDTTTSDGAADAGRLKVGTMGELQTGLDLLRLMHAPPKVTAGE